MSDSKKYPELKNIDYAQVGQDILAFWKDNQIFEKSISTREGNATFTFYEGPPSANGTPGIHHVMARAVKDIFCRYKTMQGFQVKRKGGWDTHGLPVELQVEKELGITKEDIGKKISIADYNQKCKEAVMKYTALWNELTEKMGYWVDLENPYITYEPEYIESLWFLLKRLYDKQLLYQGYTIQPYSPAAGTGLSSHELNQPGTYKNVKDTSVVAQFKLKNTGHVLETELAAKAKFPTYLLAWTTTPWTLPANSALIVGEGIKYIQVETYNPYTFEGISLILAKDLFGKYFSEKQVEADFETYQAGDKLIPVRHLGEFTGKQLLGLQYEQLLPYVTPEKAAFRVIPGDFVTTEDGTGIVHCSPTFGADDFRAAQQNDIPAIMVPDEMGKMVPIVDKQGRFVKEITDFAGMYVKNYNNADETAPDYKSTDVLISIKLKTENKAFKVEKYEHSYPHCWRTDKPVLYYPLDSWFIRTTAFKEDLVELNKTINWKPASTGQGRFGNWLENLVDWNLSRSRYWGTPLPIWKTEDGQEEICVGSVSELANLAQLAIDSGKLDEGQKAKNLAFLDTARRFLEKPHSKSQLVQSPQEPHPKSLSRGEGLEDNTNEDLPMGKGISPLSLGEESGVRSFATQQAKSWQDFIATSPTNKWKVLKEFSRENRKNQTKAEEIVWDIVRNNKLGFKVRRQHAIGGFIADFVCIPLGIVVEVDGGYHNKQDQADFDVQRSEFLKEHGFGILRFTNEEVVDNIESVRSRLKAFFDERNNLLTERPHPKSLSRGEGLEDNTNEDLPMGKGISPLSLGEGSGVRSFSKHKIDAGVSFLDLHRPHVDNIFLISPSGQVMTRVLDLIDVWFDSGAMPYAQWHWPFENHDTFSESFPADFIAEGVDQTRGWFFTLHAISTMLFGDVAFKNVIANGLVLDKNGNKMSKRLGNAVDPFETIAKFGPDPTRWYMISNAPPWENLKFNLDGVQEVQRKFFGTLANTYSFFALYANLDGFSYQESEIELAERTEADRWILSKMNSMVKVVSAAYDDYDPTRATRAIQDFVVDDLSNWYVRLNRKRFWKGEPGKDKNAAYQTLYTCLATSVKLAAPVAPFFAETLFMSLNGVSGKEIAESVHLAEFPKANESAIDAALEQRMDLAQKIASLVHGLRKKHTLKVRQPLSRMIVPVLDNKVKAQIEAVSELILSEVNIKNLELLDDASGLLVKKARPNFKKLGKSLGEKMKFLTDVVKAMTQEQIQAYEQQSNITLELGGEPVTLQAEDLEILTEDIPGWVVASENGVTVALDLTLTEELKQEGIARDMVNRLQNLRKDMGLDVQAKINIEVEKVNNLLIEAALASNKEYICTETQALDLRLSDKLDQGTEVDMDDFVLKVNITEA